MRTGNELPIAWMDLQVVHGDGGQIAVEHEPRAPRIQRGIDATLCAGVQQRRIHRILAHHIHRVGEPALQSVRDRPEAFPEIG